MRESDRVDEASKFKKLNSFDPQISTSKHDDILMWLYEKIDEDYIRETLDIPKPLKIYSVKKLIEHPLDKVGFADLALFVDSDANLNPEEIRHNYEWKEYRRAVQEREALPWREQENYKLPPKPVNEGTYSTRSSHSLFFEVKTSVNLGETIRQINFYKSRATGTRANWIVCAPKFNGIDVLKSQSIEFITYAPDL